MVLCQPATLNRWIIQHPSGQSQGLGTQQPPLLRARSIAQGTHPHFLPPVRLLLKGKLIPQSRFSSIAGNSCSKPEKMRGQASLGGVGTQERAWRVTASRCAVTFWDEKNVLG